MNAAPQPPFPTLRAAATLTATAILLAAAAWVVVPRIYGHEHLVTRAVEFAAVLTWAASIVGILPVAVLGPHSVMPAVYGYFIGMAARLTVCLIAANIANHVYGIPGSPMAATLGILYMPLLMVEVAFVGRYVWLKDKLKHGEVAL